MIAHLRNAAAAAASLLIACWPSHATAAEPLREQAQAFIDRMVSEHSFDRAQLEGFFSDLEVNANVIKLISPPERGGRPKTYWSKYRERHVSGRIIRGGTLFLRTYSGLLARAEDEYGIPRSIIAAIIGIETRYGSYIGDFSVLEALATLGLAYPPRAEFFLGELEQLFLLVRENDLDITELNGSYAGAFGLPQFLPSSARNWGIDFDGDETVDLFTPADAIGSVANFLKQHGWVRGMPVAFPVKLERNARPWTLLGDDIIPSHDAAAFTKAGITVEYADEPFPGNMTLVDLEERNRTIYRAGTRNYYVLTRYNRSNKYAMAVLDLATELAARTQ